MSQLSLGATTWRTSIERVHAKARGEKVRARHASSGNQDWTRGAGAGARFPAIRQAIIWPYCLGELPGDSQEGEEKKMRRILKERLPGVCAQVFLPSSTACSRHWLSFVGLVSGNRRSMLKAKKSSARRGASRRQQQQPVSQSASCWYRRGCTAVVGMLPSEQPQPWQ